MRSEECTAEGFWVNDKYGNRKAWKPPQTFTVHPTLGEAVKPLWDDYGPLSLTWRAGWLCPFCPGVGHQNKRCVAGRRHSGTNHCGLVISEKHINPDWLELQPRRAQEKILGGVICYPWSFELTNAYYEIEMSDYYDWPDEPGPVRFDVLLKVYRKTDWFRWKWEGERRKTASRGDWLRKKETGYARYVPQW